MTVKPAAARFATGQEPEANNNIAEMAPQRETDCSAMANSWYTASFGVVLWLAITVLNVANLVLLAWQVTSFCCCAK